jgi:hypothetical protein
VLTIPQGLPALVIDLPVDLAVSPKLEKTAKVTCLLKCDAPTISLQKMRDHVGRHLLLASRGTLDPLKPKVKVREYSTLIEINIQLNRSQIEPGSCGFCGLLGCITRLRVTARGQSTIFSTCRYRYEEMRYTTARKVSSQSPCTNVPIHCELCPPSALGEKRTVWKYGMPDHIRAEHTDDDLPHSLLAEMFVSKDEEARIGVHLAHTLSHRQEHQIPSTEGLIHLQQTGEKRARAETVTSLNEPERQRLRSGSVMADEQQDSDDADEDPHLGSDPLRSLQASPEPFDCPNCGEQIAHNIAIAPRFQQACRRMDKTHWASQLRRDFCRMHRRNAIEMEAKTRGWPLQYSRESLVQRVRDLKTSLDAITKNAEAAQSSPYFRDREPGETIGQQMRHLQGNRGA